MHSGARKKRSEGREENKNPPSVTFVFDRYSQQIPSSKSLKCNFFIIEIITLL